jgi:aryl-alcohol dehydrogenase-like predicted oxidoreductase
MAKVSDFASKICLGSVQFGQAYGISNTSGQVGVSELQDILEFASVHGIRFIDTAKAYGQAENVLSPHAKKFQILTKLSGIEERNIDDVVASVVADVSDSLMKLGIPRLHALLLHRERDLLGTRADIVWAAMQKVKQSGLAEKIGVSSQDPIDLKDVLSRFSLDFVQAPYNLTDGRFFTNDLLSHFIGVEIQVRSVFLQGLLFFKPGLQPKKLSFANRELNAIWKFASALGAPPAQLSLSAALTRKEIDQVVIGVTSRAELQEIFNWEVIEISSAGLDSLRLECDLSSGRLQNPARW